MGIVGDNGQDATDGGVTVPVPFPVYITFKGTQLLSASVKVDSGNCTLSVIGPANKEKGKKRARTDDQSTSGASPSKKTKGDSVAKKPARVRVPRPAKVNVAAKAALKAKQREASATQPKWHTLPTPVSPKDREQAQFTSLRPRLWTSDKEELVAILAELSGPKCVNGVSWLFSPNPMIVLDDATYCFEANMIDSITVDLTTTRSFICPAASVAPPVAGSDLDESLLGMTVLDETAMDTVPPAIFNHTINNGTGMRPFDTDLPDFQIMSDPEGLIPTTVTQAPPCLRHDSSEVVNAMTMDYGGPPKQEFTYSTPCCFSQETVHSQIDKLDAEESNQLVDYIANVVGLEPKTDTANLSAVFGSNGDQRHLVGVGDSNIFDLADQREEGFGDMSIQDSDKGITLLSQDNFPLPVTVPSPLPQEVQALIDAYVFGTPLTVIVSNERLYEHWSLHLPREYGYVGMGFYKIIGVEEYRAQSPRSKSSPQDIVSGRVCWRFRIRWCPGGEECIWQNRIELKHPWWFPTYKPPAPSNSEVGRRPLSEPEDQFPTNSKYLDLHRQHHAYQWRHDPLQELYYYLFPAHLLLPFTALLPDANFPRGWICRECGRMNFQRSIRCRKCPGASCKSSKAVSYFLDLFVLRNPQDRLTLPLPYNTYPEDVVKVRHARWDDGIQTFSCLMPNVNETAGRIEHVFTGNISLLQNYAGDFLKCIQLEVDIVRKPGDNGPFFSYSVDFRRNYSNVNMEGSGFPEVITDIKDCMVERAKSYGRIDEKDIQIDQLDILAWVTSGSRKYPTSINATKKAVVLLCLGCNITLNVTPHVKKTPTTEADEREEPQGHAGWITRDLGDEPMEETSLKKQTATSKKDRSSISFSLVHGDMLVFFGDKFEYSMKRHGTSFLLIGSDPMSDS